MMQLLEKLKKLLCLHSIVCCCHHVLCYESKRANATDIKKVHLIFMNELDVGFDGLDKEKGLVNNVLNKYFQVYFPRAITLAESLVAIGYNERFIYTTHPWLVSMYINCPPNLKLSGILLQCPKPEDLQKFYAAVKRGDITWHAGPMNMQYEMMDKMLIDFGLQISDDLDKEFFDVKRPFKTLSQRNVPGMSKFLLPMFAERGIEAISVGVNPMSAPPDVPVLFTWKHQSTSLIAMWHPGGYPQAPGKKPSQPGGLSEHDCVTFPGLSEALCFAFRTDNSGPPASYEEVLVNFEIARSQFPKAVVKASTFGNFVEVVQTIKHKLPVVTKEIGDTWIQGPSSDPRKTAEMRAYCRLRTQCIQQGRCDINDVVFYNSSLIMVKLGEHTWGINGLLDTIHYSNPQFRNQLNHKALNYEISISSWLEQREFMYLSLSTLGNHPLATEVKKQFQQMKAKKPDLSGYKEVSISNVFTCSNGFKYKFGEDGSIISLIDIKTGMDWASADNSLGKFIYQTYNQSDFTHFESEYSFNGERVGIGKYNMSRNSNASSQSWFTTLKTLYQATGGNCNFLINIRMASEECIINYGAPRDIWIHYSDVNNEGLSVDLQWFDKSPTRLPEAILFTFNPVVQIDKKWVIHKLGHHLDPLDVTTNGSQRLHAADGGAAYISQDMRGMYIITLDATIATVLTTDNPLTSLPLPLTPIKDVTGIGFNLFNNIWDVNWILWYPFMDEDKDQKFRFNIIVGT